MLGAFVVFITSRERSLTLTFSSHSDEVPEFITSDLPHCISGICLTDPSDARHQFVIQLRHRAGTTFHEAVSVLKSNTQEDSIECTRMLISSIRVLQLDYPADHTHHAAVKRAYEFALQISRTTRNQKLFPRCVIVRTGAVPLLRGLTLSNHCAGLSGCAEQVSTTPHDFVSTRSTDGGHLSTIS